MDITKAKQLANAVREFQVIEDVISRIGDARIKRIEIETNQHISEICLSVEVQLSDKIKELLLSYKTAIENFIKEN